MSHATDEEAKAVTGLIKGAKIIIPFVVSIASVVGVYYKMSNDINNIRTDLENERKNTAKIEAQQIMLSSRVSAQEITLTEVKTDLKHIKNDTKETLDLVRSFIGRR